MKKYKGNWSNSSSNGTIGGFEDTNAKRLEKDLKDIARGNGGGKWWIEVYDIEIGEYVPYKDGFVKGLYA